MGFWDKLKGELVDIVEWTDDSSDTLVFRFERYNNEIKYGAKLTVREGQNAVFVNEGKIADVFQPGMYELITKNLPILSTLKGWLYGFNSPFKAEVYFASTRRFTNQRWGTKSPVMLRDSDFGAVRLRAFGTYVFRVKDAATLIKEIVGTDGHFTIEEINKQLSNIVVSRFGDALAESGIPALDIAANYDEIGEGLLNKIAPEIEVYGLDLTKLLVENVSLPPEVEKALDTRSSMGIVGDMRQFQQYQAGAAILDAANNEGSGGLAAGGLAAGLGFGFANQMTSAVSHPSAAPPPPPPVQTQLYVLLGGQQTGPFPLQVIRQQVSSGAIRRDTYVWKQGMSQWARASQVAEVEAMFASMPPPPPPQL